MGSSAGSGIGSGSGTGSGSATTGSPRGKGDYRAGRRVTSGTAKGKRRSGKQAGFLSGGDSGDRIGPFRIISQKNYKPLKNYLQISRICVIIYRIISGNMHTGTVGGHTPRSRGTDRTLRISCFLQIIPEHARSRSAGADSAGADVHTAQAV